MSLEIELILSVDPTSEYVTLIYDQLRLMDTQEIACEELISSYFDTRDLSLWKHGFSLRIREEVDHLTQTLKTMGERRDNLQYRDKWLIPIPIKEIMPDIHAFKDKEVTKKLATIIGKQPLIRVFETRFLRSRWSLDPKNDTKLEIAFDQGILNMRNQHMFLHEIEIELKKGDANQIEKVAAMLKKKIPLTVQTSTKEERGYKLYTFSRGIGHALNKAIWHIK